MQDGELIKELVNFKEESSKGGQDENIKTKDILVFILESIYNLNRSKFAIIGVNLGYENSDDIAVTQNGVDSKQNQDKEESFCLDNTKGNQIDSTTD